MTNRIEAFGADGRRVTLRRIPIEDVPPGELDDVPPGELDDVPPDLDHGSDLDGGPQRPTEAPELEPEAYDDAPPTEEDEAAALGKALLDDVLSSRIDALIDPALKVGARAIFDEVMEQLPAKVEKALAPLLHDRGLDQDLWETIGLQTTRQQQAEKATEALKAEVMRVGVDVVQEARTMLRAELTALREEAARTTENAVAHVLEAVKTMLATKRTIEYDQIGRPVSVTQAPVGVSPAIQAATQETVHDGQSD